MAGLITIINPKGQTLGPSGTGITYFRDLEFVKDGPLGDGVLALYKSGNSSYLQFYRLVGFSTWELQKTIKSYAGGFFNPEMGGVTYDGKDIYITYRSPIGSSFSLMKIDWNGNTLKIWSNTIGLRLCFNGMNVCAINKNAGGDTIQVIDTDTGSVTKSISLTGSTNQLTGITFNGMDFVCIYDSGLVGYMRYYDVGGNLLKQNLTARATCIAFYGMNYLISSGT